MKQKYFEIESGHKIPIKYELFYKVSESKKPLTIILHGFKAFRNWGFIPHLSQSIASNVGPTIAIDFSMNGIVDDEKMWYDVEVFRKNTIGVELEDLQKLINSLDNLNIENWNGDINLIGHSMGGAISILTAGKNDQVKKLSLWGTISKWNRNTKRQIDEWRNKGFMEFQESLTGQTLYLDFSYQQYKDDLREQIDIRKTISSLDIPIQIIHGSLDLTVPPKEGEILFSKVKNKENSELHIIPKTGHTFGAKHPFEKSNKQLEDSINHTIKFLNS